MNNKRVFKRTSHGFVQLIGCGAAPLLLLLAFLVFATVGGGLGTDSAYGGTLDTVPTLGVVKLPATEGKMGYEEHFKASCITGGIHYQDALSDPLTYVANCGSFGSGMETAQERWYFNMRWQYTASEKPEYRHTKVIITHKTSGRRLVASIEEMGPAEFKWTQDGINSGGPPDVFNYLCFGEEPNSGNPNDDACRMTYGIAKDQNIPLGPINTGATTP